MSAPLVIAALVGGALGAAAVLLGARARRTSQAATLGAAGRGRPPASGPVVPTGWTRAARAEIQRAVRVEGTAPAVSRTQHLEGLYPVPSGWSRPPAAPGPARSTPPAAPSGPRPAAGWATASAVDAVVDAREPRRVELSAPSPVRVTQALTRPRARQKVGR